MKSIGFLQTALSLAATLWGMTLSAQTLYVPGGTSTGIGSSSTSNVGIGIANPSEQLQLGGNILLAANTNNTGALLGYPSSDYFTTNGVAMPHYGLKWASPTDTSGITLMASGYFGIELFTSGVQRVKIGGDGHIGIGAPNGSALLQIGSFANQSLKVGLSGNAANANVEIRDSIASVATDANNTASNGAVAWNFYNSGSSPSWSGTLLQYFGSGVTGTAYGLSKGNLGVLVFQNVSNGVIATNNSTAISISPSGVSTTFLPNGNVGIGTTNPTQKLSVNGTIRAKEVIVDTGWSDYVFASDYRLAPLSEVEIHIKANGHLPGIPSAKEVAEHGVSMGEMQAKLLAKIEELTLHQIEQEKRISELRQEIETLRGEK